MQIQFNVYFQDNPTSLCFIAVKLLLMNDSQVMLQDICYNCSNGNTKNWRTQMQFMQFNSSTINQKQQACGSWRKARVKTKEQTSSANKSKWEKAKYKKKHREKTLKNAATGDTRYDNEPANKGLILRVNVKHFKHFNDRTLQPLVYFMTNVEGPS